MVIRIATLKDVETLVNTRKIQLIDEGEPPCIGIDDELRGFFTDKLTDGTLIQYIFEENDELIATGGVIYMEFPPSGTNSSGKVAYVANVYTKPEYRRRGLSTKILSLLKDDAQSKKVTRMRLIASKVGVLVYEKFGFKLSNSWMDLYL